MEYLTFPEGKTPTVVEKGEDNFIFALNRLAETSPDHIFGFDMEWEVDFANNFRSPATVQVSSSDGTSYLFRLIVQGKSRVSESLRKFLEDKNNLFVGSNIANDASRLARGHGVELSGFKEISNKARRLGFTKKRMALDALVKKFLNKKIRKHNNLRFAKWEKKQLLNDEIDYACLDAYSSLLVFMELVERQDENLVPGKKVQVMSKSGKTVMAIGFLQNWKEDNFKNFKLKSKGKDRVVLSFVKSDRLNAKLFYHFNNERNGEEIEIKSMRDLKEGDLFLWDRSRIAPLYDEDSVDDIEFVHDSFSLLFILDIFHGMTRVTKHIKTSHGAFPAFVSRLRDAIFIVNEDDLNTYKSLLKARGMNDDESEAYVRKHWNTIIKTCRRRVPQKETLEKRYIEVIICTFLN